MPTKKTMNKPIPTLRELFEIARDNAAKCFLAEGEVVPMWHAVPADGSPHMLIATPWGGDDEKIMAVEFLRDKFAEYRIQRYAFLVEAWVVEKARTLSGPPPSKHPDRREVVRIQCEDRDGSTLSGHYYILRPEHGPVTLSPFHEDPPEMIAAGRMSGMLSEVGR